MLAKVNAAREHVTAYSFAIGTANAGGGTTPNAPERPAPSKRPPNAVAADGSEYRGDRGA